MCLHLSHEALERSGALNPLQALGVSGHLAPLGRELGRYVEVELKRIRALVTKACFG
jgi:hypothetical protein